MAPTLCNCLSLILAFFDIWLISDELMLLKYFELQVLGKAEVETQEILWSNEGFWSDVDFIFFIIDPFTNEYGIEPFRTSKIVRNNLGANISMIFWNKTQIKKLKSNEKCLLFITTTHHFLFGWLQLLAKKNLLQVKGCKIKLVGQHHALLILTKGKIEPMKLRIAEVIYLKRWF